MTLREEAFKDVLVDFAIALLEMEHPLPIDIETRLLEMGIDVAYLKLKYGSK